MASSRSLEPTPPAPRKAILPPPALPGARYHTPAPDTANNSLVARKHTRLATPEPRRPGRRRHPRRHRHHPGTVHVLPTVLHRSGSRSWEGSGT